MRGRRGSRGLAKAGLVTIVVLVAVVPVAATDDLPTAAMLPGADDGAHESPLSATRMEVLLARAPMEGSKDLYPRPIVLLPTADGRRARFEVEEISVMEPGLAARFPQIRTYRAIGLDDPTATARLNLTPSGFRAMVLTSAGTILVEPDEDLPLERSRIVLPHLQVISPQWQCSTQPRVKDIETEPATMRLSRAVAGAQIRTYRIAIATTAEYTAFHGGTVESGLAEVVTVLNRVSGVLERDAAIRLLLVDRNDRLIYTDPASDPYTPENREQITGENQTNVDRVIGTQNYDIGHVFSAYPGGRADGLACREGRKASAVSGLTRPTTDFFAIQLVAHEIGHQFYASHTYNGTTGSCGNYRYPETAWEPGSGSTIMSYAGICGEENIVRRGDDYFHTGSIDEMIGYVTAGHGATCGEVAPSGNRPPTADAGRRRTIPAETPFVLRGEGSDPDGDPLTYTWEQFDLGPPSPPLADDGMRPLFRSVPPGPEPIRILPRVKDLRRGRTTKKEVLPTTTRGLTFRLTVRDGKGGVARDTLKLEVIDEAGPFRVLEPRKKDLWIAGNQETIAWDVADTHLRPIRCRSVDLRLSTDSGRTFPILLATKTRNNGFATVTVPPLSTGKARIQVACSNHLFFAISDGNFRIQR